MVGELNRKVKNWVSERVSIEPTLSEPTANIHCVIWNAQIYHHPGRLGSTPSLPLMSSLSHAKLLVQPGIFGNKIGGESQLNKNLALHVVLHGITLATFEDGNNRAIIKCLLDTFSY
jgi:hypothetical protein